MQGAQLASIPQTAPLLFCSFSFGILFALNESQGPHECAACRLLFFYPGHFPFWEGPLPACFANQAALVLSSEGRAKMVSVSSCGTRRQKREPDSVSVAFLLSVHAVTGAWLKHGLYEWKRSSDRIATHTHGLSAAIWSIRWALLYS